jgi:hypothetical protein
MHFVFQKHVTEMSCKKTATGAKALHSTTARRGPLKGRSSTALHAAVAPDSLAVALASQWLVLTAGR